jgi:Tfp pilus assembly protein PilO
MAALKKAGGLTIVAMLVVAALAIAFWVLLLSPKRDEAAKLGKQVGRAEESLAQHRSEVATAEQARRQFPVDYRKLVVLGKAVPAGDETASLLVQINGVADRAKVEFQDISLSDEGGGSEEEESAAPTSSTTGAQVSATEAEAALLPLGASIGPAGLAVMPYSLTFVGDFFQIADFIQGLDSLVKSHNENVAVKGRLVTIDEFTLTPEGEGEPGEGGSGGSSPVLTASFSVTTYVTPPDQGITAGASPSSPLESSATPASTTTGGTP